MLVSAIYADFVRHHREHNTAKTVAYYAGGLRWLLAQFADIDWEQLDRIAVKDALFASYHKADGAPMSNATHRRNKVSFGQLQKHALEQDFTTRMVLTEKDLKKPGCGRRESVPAADDLDKLIAAATPATAIAFRALRASGMRPGELCQADVGMIEGEGEGRALVLKKHKTAKKTGKPRTIALGGDLAGLVDEAIAGRTDGPIWRDDDGERWTPERLSARVRGLRKRLKLPAGLVLYGFRHYVGTWVTREAGIEVAKEMLGHTSIGMTTRYHHGDRSDQLKAQKALEAMEKRRKRKDAA